jgi:hypothetical protein
MKMRLHITSIQAGASAADIHPRNVGATHNMLDPSIPCVCPVCQPEFGDCDDGGLDESHGTAASEAGSDSSR